MASVTCFRGSLLPSFFYSLLCFLLYSHSFLIPSSAFFLFTLSLFFHSPLPTPPQSPPRSPSPPFLLIPQPLCLLKVWILGEYSHTGYDARCTTSLLVQYFEVRALYVLCQKPADPFHVLPRLPHSFIHLFPLLFPHLFLPSPSFPFLFLPLFFRSLLSSSTTFFLPLSPLSPLSPLFPPSSLLDLRVYSVRGGAEPPWPPG